MTMMKSKLSRLLLSLLGISIILSPKGAQGVEIKEKLFINFGGGSYVDANGNEWVADTEIGVPGGRYKTANGIKGTANDEMYQTELWYNSKTKPMTIEIPVEDGLYEIKMHFAEIFPGAQKVNARVFDCLVQDVVVYKDLDIFALVGGYTALTINAATKVEGGILKVELKRVLQNPKISGLEIYRVAEKPESNDFVPLFINAGGDEYIDKSGRVWAADKYFVGTTVAYKAEPSDVPSTSDNELYQSERFGTRGSLKYEIPVPNGSYRTTLHFAEIYPRYEETAAGRRVFDVAVQDYVVIEDVDIWSEVGFFTAMTKEVPAVVKDGKLKIELLKKNGYPKISGIQIEPIKDVYEWDSYGAKGLEMVVLNAVDSSWDSTFFNTIRLWNGGDQSTLNLLTIDFPPDSACAPIPGRIKVCNGDYGDQQWVGLNTVTLQNGYIRNSVVRMNDFYLEMATEDQRSYAMCHEMGHALGLPHTDEDYYNDDRGNCLDYTLRPEDNISAGSYNFDLLAQIYGVRNKQRMLAGTVKKPVKDEPMIIEQEPPKNVQFRINNFVTEMQVMSCDEWENLSDVKLKQRKKSDLGEACELDLGGGYSVQIRKLLVWPGLLP